MSEKDQEALWEEEAKQLKEDLKSRPKEVQRREVQIRFGKGQKSAPPKSTPPASPGEDHYLRQQLGLDEEA
jgi:hypothetical protein